MFDSTIHWITYGTYPLKSDLSEIHRLGAEHLWELVHEENYF